MLDQFKSYISLNKESNFLENIKNLQDLKNLEEAKSIFSALENQDKSNKLMFVGGCVRKLLNKELVNDIDIATNLSPDELKNILRENNINFIETGIAHGTITVVINKIKFEITTLRKDVSTDGRHANVEFISDWEMDAKRRDFTINAIYSDLKGAIYDPLDGLKDLKNGIVKFIGDPNKRIREDYLRILRYFRFYTQYSNHQHDIEIIQAIKKNLNGIRKISKERILDELFKILNLNNFYELFNDEFSCSVILTIFPQLRHYDRLKVIQNIPNKIFSRLDIPLIFSILLIDNSDNCEFFLYKFKFSNIDKNRI
jgi:poly(A) polymerase